MHPKYETEERKVERKDGKEGGGVEKKRMDRRKKKERRSKEERRKRKRKTMALCSVVAGRILSVFLL